MPTIPTSPLFSLLDRGLPTLFMSSSQEASPGHTRKKKKTLQLTQAIICTTYHKSCHIYNLTIRYFFGRSRTLDNIVDINGYYLIFELEQFIRFYLFKCHFLKYVCYIVHQSFAICYELIWEKILSPNYLRLIYLNNIKYIFFLKKITH